MAPEAPMSPFLKIPRELRNIIYTYLLTQPKICLESSVIGTTTPAYAEMIQPDLPPRKPRRARSTWVQNTVDYVNRYVDVTPISVDCDEIVDVEVTYQVALNKLISAPYLDIFLTSRQIYSEAREIFYGKNIFCFSADFRIPTAFHFLKDRPSASLACIRSMELHLLEEYYRDETVSVLTLYSFTFFTDLCAILASPQMRIQSFRLGIHALAMSEQPYVPGMRLADYLKREKTRGFLLDPPDWMQPMLEIRGLDSLTVYWDSIPVSQVLRAAKSIKIMRLRMLKNGEAMVDWNLVLRSRHYSEDIARRRENVKYYRVSVDRDGNYEVTRLEKGRYWRTNESGGEWVFDDLREKEIDEMMDEMAPTVNSDLYDSDSDDEFSVEGFDCFCQLSC